MSRALLLDTDLLIDHLRGRSEAVSWLKEHRDERLLVSTLTLAELYAGIRDGHERDMLDLLMEFLEVVPADHTIGRSGGLLRRDFGKSHGTQLIDALVAATAEKTNSRLVTLNRKHFPMLTDVLVPYQKT